VIGVPLTVTSTAELSRRAPELDPVCAVAESDKKSAKPATKHRKENSRGDKFLRCENIEAKAPSKRHLPDGAS
jgi:hypothetical protein